jgi:hypothetical protein
MYSDPCHSSLTVRRMPDLSCNSNIGGNHSMYGTFSLAPLSELSQIVQLIWPEPKTILASRFTGRRGSRLSIARVPAEAGLSRRAMLGPSGKEKSSLDG